MIYNMRRKKTGNILKTPRVIYNTINKKTTTKDNNHLNRTITNPLNNIQTNNHKIPNKFNYPNNKNFNCKFLIKPLISNSQLLIKVFLILFRLINHGVILTT